MISDSYTESTLVSPAILMRFLRAWKWASLGGTIMTIINLLVIKFSPQILYIAFFQAGLAMTAWFVVRHYEQTQQTQYILPAFISSVSLFSTILSLLLHEGFYLVPTVSIICMLFAMILGKGRYQGVIIGGAILLFLALAMLDRFQVFAVIALPDSNQTVMILIGLMTVFIGVVGVCVAAIERAFRQALNNAQHRQMQAEQSQAEQQQTFARLTRQTQEQARLLELVHELETPIIPVLDGVLVLPITGHLDTTRLIHMSDLLLQRVNSEHAHTVLIDVTGLATMDTATANHLLQLTQGVRLLGAQCILTGLRSDVAYTIANQGMNFRSLKTAASLRDAIAALIQVPA